MENSNLYQSILRQDYNVFKNSLQDISILEYDPIFLIIDTFTEDHKLSIARLMIQELINKDVPRENALSEFMPLLETLHQNSGKARLIKFTIDTKGYSGSNVIVPSNRRAPEALPIVSNDSSSNYSMQELLQLKQIANDLGIHITTNTNLALKIIHNLRHKLNQQG